ncbi:MAG: gamma-glutamyl-gamma-aminobutyrate hydrolase family protein [Thermoanaerobaculia bacterium]
MKIAVTIEDGTRGADYIGSLDRAGFSAEEVLAVHSADASPFAFDGLLLGGGEDVDPDLYGAPRHERLGRVNRRRDEQELALIARARRNRVPTFGICRGLQVLNVAFGGTLVQDIPSQRPSAVEHSVKAPRDARAHSVRPERDGFLVSFGEFSVNSRHHQAVDRLGSGLRPSAFSPEGLVEAVEAQDSSPVFAVQWHPENMTADPVAKFLFEKFRESVDSRIRNVQGESLTLQKGDV